MAISDNLIIFKPILNAVDRKQLLNKLNNNELKLLTLTISLFIKY